MQDPYSILGVSRDASDEDIKKAYRKLSRIYHPDANINNPNKDQAEAKFKEIQQAYQQIMKEKEMGASGYTGTGSGGYGDAGSGYGGFGGFGPFGGFYGQYTNQNQQTTETEEDIHLRADNNDRAITLMSDDCRINNKTKRRTVNDNIIIDILHGLQHTGKTFGFQKLCRIRSLRSGKKNMKFRNICRHNHICKHTLSGEEV